MSFWHHGDHDIGPLEHLRVTEDVHANLLLHIPVDDEVVPCFFCPFEGMDDDFDISVGCELRESEFVDCHLLGGLEGTGLSVPTRGLIVNLPATILQCVTACERLRGPSVNESKVSLEPFPFLVHWDRDQHLGTQDF